MIDRQKLETLLKRRFPLATWQEVASTANAIMGLDDEWEEIVSDHELGYHVSAQCNDICELARRAEEGMAFRVLRKRIQ